jgi:hypothetical protein
MASNKKNFISELTFLLNIAVVVVPPGADYIASAAGSSARDELGTVAAGGGASELKLKIIPEFSGCM